jgi:Icc-related predicted phosphoesterase
LVKPKLHVFGHIHEAWGTRRLQGTLYVNASICDHTYQVKNLRPPTVVDIKPEGGVQLIEVS